MPFYFFSFFFSLFPDRKSVNKRDEKPAKSSVLLAYVRSEEKRTQLGFTIDIVFFKKKFSEPYYRSYSNCQCLT